MTIVTSLFTDFTDDGPLYNPDSADIAFLRNMRYDITDLNGVKNIET